ncbi:MAG TPA: alkaline phosphatase D family protein [Kofleriaceae bacterium]|nr:alkaline phosphatase D family protein [Kofleriaceae bacterium]
MITRRGFMIGGAASLVACRVAPVTRIARPQHTHGLQIGDVSTERALVWARCSEPARLELEWDTTPRFANARRTATPTAVTPDSDFAATVPLDKLPSAQRVFVRARFTREADRGTSDWATASFATPGTAPFRVAWTGDTCGQGFGRNPDWGGLRGYAAVRDAKPAFLIHSGDLIYADNPIESEKRTLDGKLWRNISNERVARVAQDLDDFRARFAYNLEDDHVRALAAEVPILAQWDDHETHNNWFPSQTLDDDRYTKLRDASRLAAFAQRAMREWTPMPQGPVHRVVSYGPLLDVIVLDCRSFRTPNDAGAGTAMLGAAQAAWFVDAVSRSRATWKIIACDQPLGLIIPDGPRDDRFEGYGNVAGPPLGREIELAAMLAELKARNAKNFVFITADVHYAAAHRFDPSRASVPSAVSFDPFWELVAGPIHAGTFGPNELDPSLGPELVFQWAPPPGTGNLAPWDGLQSFGTIDVSADALAISLLSIDGKKRFAVEVTRAA